MKFKKEQKHEDRFNQIKEWMKQDKVFNDVMNEVFESYDFDEMSKELIEEYFKNINDTKEYSEEMLMKVKQIDECDFEDYIKWYWGCDEGPYANEDEICAELGVTELYVGDGMWWDNVNKRYYSED